MKRKRKKFIFLKWGKSGGVEGEMGISKQWENFKWPNIKVNRVPKRRKMG